MHISDIKEYLFMIIILLFCLRCNRSNCKPSDQHINQSNFWLTATDQKIKTKINKSTDLNIESRQIALQIKRSNVIPIDK